MDTDDDHLIIYAVKNLDGIDTAKRLIVLLNGSAEKAEAEVPEAEYTVLAHDGKADVSGFGQINGGKVIVEPYSATILAEY